MRINSQFQHTILATFIYSALACTNVPRQQEMSSPPVDVSSHAAKEENAKNFVEIKFDQGSSDLSESSKAALQDLLSESKSEGQLRSVKALSWADDEYPSMKTKHLSKAQRDLADKRNASIKSYVRSLESVRVDSFNMAEQPNILAKWVKTDDAKLKQTLVDSGLATTASDPTFTGKASHAIVLVVTK